MKILEGGEGALIFTLCLSNYYSLFESMGSKKIASHNYALVDRLTCLYQLNKSEPRGGVDQKIKTINLYLNLISF